MKCRLSLSFRRERAFRTAWLEITSRGASFGCGVLFAGAQVRLVKRLIALHGHPVAAAHRRDVIKYGVVLNAAVVPEGDRVLPPSEPAAKLRPLIAGHGDKLDYPVALIIFSQGPHRTRPIRRRLALHSRSNSRDRNNERKVVRGRSQSHRRRSRSVITAARCCESGGVFQACSRRGA